MLFGSKGKCCQNVDPYCFYHCRQAICLHTSVVRDISTSSSFGEASKVTHGATTVHRPTAAHTHTHREICLCHPLPLALCTEAVAGWCSLWGASLSRPLSLHLQRRLNQGYQECVCSFLFTSTCAFSSALSCGPLAPLLFRASLNWLHLQA